MKLFVYLWGISCECVHFLMTMMYVQCVYHPTEVKLVLVLVLCP